MATDAEMVPNVEEFTDGPDAMADGMDEVGKEVNITPDGGLIKKIITLGDGWENPEKGDEVTVHYVGTLEDGTPFDSSRDRGEPFVFTIGEGRVIKGWDQGVATMKKGEKSLLICRSDYAYGASGSPPKIPPNATLHFEVELFSWKSVKDIMGDGGVIKTVLEEGGGWETCKEPYEAVVSYKARVAGCEAPFAEAEGVVFTVSEGHLVPGIKEAVRTMKKGDKVQLKLKPQYGFGEAGSAEHGVPPNADLEVELTLAKWHKVEDVTDDGLVVMKLLHTDDDQYEKPNEGAKVTVWATGKLLDGTVFEQHAEGSELTFTTGEEQVCEGLDEAVMKMKKGDRAVVTINDPKYAFGDAGKLMPLAMVPPNASVVYEVQLLGFVNAKASWEMKDEEKVEDAKAKKEKGNAHFKAGRLAKAGKLWDKAVALVQFDKNFPEEVKAAVRDVKRSCWLNMAAVALKQQHWKDAIKHCDKVLEMESSNVKALYRRAQAKMGMQDLFDAEQDLRQASYAEPENADVAALTKKLKLLQKQQNKKEASLYSKMFKPSPAPAAPAKEASAAAGGQPDATPAVDAAVADVSPAAVEDAMAVSDQ